MIAAYARERFRPVVFVPLAIVVALAASAGHYALGRVALDASFALLLLAEFRLWDDLADRRGDAASHPGRVLVRAGSIVSFILVCIALGVANVVRSMVAQAMPVSLPVLLALHIALALRYTLRRERTVAGDQLLLAKYPAFVVIVAGSRALEATMSVSVAALLIYGAASLYEAWHDPASPVAALLGGRS
jgi:hypothetical protein